MQKQRLGGKSYAPSEDHPLSPYSKALSDLVDFVDKMQEKVEEEKSGEGAVKKLLGCLKSHLSVGAHRMRAGAMEAALAEAADAARQAEEAEEGWLKDSVDSTPQRGVGAGGSMAGRKNMKVGKMYNSWENIVSLHFLSLARPRSCRPPLLHRPVQAEPSRAAGEAANLV